MHLLRLHHRQRAGPPHDNTVTVTFDDPDPGGPYTDTDDHSVTFDDVAPTLTVTKSANPTSVTAPGGDVTFTITVTNTSNEAVDVTELEDDRFGPLTDGVGADCDPPVTLPHHLDAANAGATDTLVCTFTAFVGGPGGTDHVNVASASVVDDDSPNPVAGSAPATVTIAQGSSADLQVDKSADPAVATVGDAVTFTIAVTNHGPDAASAVTVTDVVPDAFAIVSVATSVGTCDETGQTVTCSLGTLAVRCDGDDHDRGRGAGGGDLREHRHARHDDR